MNAARRGFSLIELLLVLVLIGLAAAVAATSLGASGPGAQRRAALAGAVSELSAARIEAMRGGRAVTAQLSADEDELAVSAGERTARWRAPGLALIDEAGRVAASAEVRFEGSGRAARDRFTLVVRGETSQPAARLWRIEFDPVSGAVSLARGPAPAAELPAPTERR